MNNKNHVDLIAIKHLLFTLFLCYCSLQSNLLQAGVVVQYDKVFATMTVATDQSAIEHIIEAQYLIDLGEYDTSITYLNIILQRYQGNNKEVKARLLGGLARNYLNLGLNRKAIQFWEDAIKLIENSKDHLFIESVFRNNMSIAYIKLGQTDKAYENLLQSLEKYPLAQTYKNLSDIALDKNKDFELSNYYLTNGLSLIQDTLYKGKVYMHEDYLSKLHLSNITEGYAYHYYIKKDYQTSLLKYQEVLSIAESLKRVRLRVKILKKIGYLYKELGDSEKSTSYLSRYISLNDSLRVIMNNSLSIPIQNFIEETEGETQASDIRSDRYVIIFIIFIAALVLYATLFYVKRKRRLGGAENLEKSNASSSNAQVSINSSLPLKMKEELMLKLQEFEVSNAFLEKDMSFSKLVAYLNSNEKYLRQILKKYKNTDYNNYINALRINYIVEKLNTDPEYLNYKISYLAAESGFSSHSKFSASFRQQVGLSPSRYIERIKEEKTISL